MRKHLIVLVLLITAALTASSAYASYWNEGNYGYDDEHAYIIDSLADFIELHDRVNSGAETAGLYYKLDLHSKTINLATSEYSNWTPIGKSDRPFMGHLNGNGHTINIAINSNLYDHIGSMGLFGYVKTADGYAIKNLTVNGTVKTGWGDNQAAGIAAHLYNASIENCTFTGEVSSANGDSRQISYTAGIVAYMHSGSVKNCTVTDAYIKAAGSWAHGYSYAGGIVSQMEGGTIEGCTVKDSTLEGTWGKSDGGSNAFQTVCVGGIASLVVQNKTSKTVRNNEAYANLIGVVQYNDKYIGGIIGKLDDTALVSENNIYGGAACGIGYDTGGSESDYPGCINASKLRLTITKTSLASATLNTQYSDVLTADVGGVDWIPVWTLKEGSTLPAGLKLNSATGEISGTPTAAGSTSFTVIATLGTNAVRTAQQTYTLTVSDPQPAMSLVITTDSLPEGTAGTNYSAALVVTFMDTPFSSAGWSISEGSLPGGLGINASTGTITGTPTESGSFTFTVRASFAQMAGEKEYTLKVNAASGGGGIITPIVDLSAPEFNDGHALVLDGQIGVIFYVMLPEEPGTNYNDKNCWMTFDIRGDKSNNPQPLDTTSRLNFTDAKGVKNYAFVCYINSAQMADTITATLHYGDNQTVTQDSSADAYLTGMMGKFSGVVKDLMIAIKDYGHYVQPMLSNANGWKIGELYLEMGGVNAYTEQDIENVRAASEPYAIIRDTGNSAVSSVGFALKLGSTTSILLYLNVPSSYAGNVTAYIEGSRENIAVKQSAAQYLVEINDIPAHELHKTNKLTVTAGSSFEVRVSALSYVNVMLTKSGIGQDIKEAVTALYKYWEAAMNYRNSQ